MNQASKNHPLFFETIKNFAVLEKTFFLSCQNICLFSVNLKALQYTRETHSAPASPYSRPLKLRPVACLQRIGRDKSAHVRLPARDVSCVQGLRAYIIH